jgi:hypothetical protein
MKIEGKRKEKEQKSELQRDQGEDIEGHDVTADVG